MSSIPVGRSKIWASQSRGLIFSRRELITSNPKISQISVQVRSIFFLFCHTDEKFGKVSNVMYRELCKRWSLSGHYNGHYPTALM